MPFVSTIAQNPLRSLIPCIKMILRADQNPCRDVALLRLYIQIHTSIQQRPIFGLTFLKLGIFHKLSPVTKS